MILHTPSDHPHSTLALHLSIDKKRVLDQINHLIEASLVEQGTLNSNRYTITISDLEINHIDKIEDHINLKGIAKLRVSGKGFMKKLAGEGDLQTDINIHYDFDSENLLQLKVNIKKLLWNRPLILHIGSKDFSLDNIGDKILSLAHHSIQDKINEKLQPRINISQYLDTKVKNILPITIPIFNHTIELFLQHLNIDVGDVLSKENSFELNSKIKLLPILSDATIGLEIKKEGNVKFLFNPTLSTNKESIHPLSYISYDLLTELILAKFEAEPIQILGKSFTITGLAISQLSEQRILVKIETNNNTIKKFDFMCSLALDQQTQTVTIDNMDLSLSNGSIIGKSLFLLEKPILAYINNKINPIMLPALFTKIDAIIENKMIEKTVQMGIKLAFQKDTTKLTSIKLLQQGIQLGISSKMSISIVV